MIFLHLTLNEIILILKIMEIDKNNNTHIKGKN